tara:strand:+ start:3088 stop:3477 length:390 start_codon:yes stop_codon:yes gene_type:complete
MIALRAAIVAAFLTTPAFAQATLPDGTALYRDNCASCHGADLKGQPDWMSPLPNGRSRAPPHDASGHTWHHSDEQLLRIIRDGLGAIAPGYESDMPVFGETLSDAEIMSILGFIKQGWPERERRYQQER